MPERVFISIGSNTGDSADNCRRAVVELEGSQDVDVVSVSSLYRTEPWGRTGQREFVNCAVEVTTRLAPTGLLDLLKGIERAMGRTPAERWGPRVIDLDIVFYGASVVSGRGLTIPHPHAHQRAFVLAPLAEIAPEFIHPVLGKSASELLEDLGAAGVERIERDPL
ncbi:MAG: 2-amino-4-hydroxy-6-hydroxymethyldihydropteridine diphosphokinase [Thermodesulfobacteriota bacterium]